VEKAPTRVLRTVMSPGSVVVLEADAHEADVSMMPADELDGRSRAGEQVLRCSASGSDPMRPFW
jgi:hypothetical protein